MAHVGLNPNKRKNVVEIMDIKTGRKFIQSASVVAGYKRGKQTPVVSEFSVRSKVTIGPANSDHAEIVRQLEELRNGNPEGYYADGEHRAAGMSEKQIYNMHYEQIARQIANERSGKKPLFGSAPVLSAPPKK